MYSFVFVTYNSAEVIEKAIRSLPADCEAIVVDNASTDNSVELARNLGATVIANKDNKGFGTGCNQGARAARFDRIFFLNPDAWLEADTLDHLGKAWDRYPQAGMLTPRIYNSDGALFFRKRSVLYTTWPWKRMKIPQADASVKFAPGSAMLFRREAFEKIGGFDEDIFLFYEDDDICLRLRNAGYEIWYIHDAVIQHSGGRSTPVTDELVAFREYEATKARAYVCRKHKRRQYVPFYLFKNAWRVLKSRMTGNHSQYVIYKAKLRAMTDGVNPIRRLRQQ